MSINAQVLLEVSYQVEQGNPWWGLALCNRYLDKNSQLRWAIIQRFLMRIDQREAGSRTAQVLIQGGREHHPPKHITNAIGTRAPRPLCAVAKPKPRLRPSSRRSVRRHENFLVTASRYAQTHHRAQPVADTRRLSG